jgi:hypothetical protein
MAAKIRYSKMVKTCKNMFHMIAQHESWNHDIFGRVPRDYVRFHFLGFCISWPDLNLSSSQLISAHLSSKYHEFQWNLEFWCGHVQMDHHGSEDICLKRFRVTFGWNQPEFLCFCAIEIDRSAEEPSKFTDFWIYADTQKKHNKWSTVIYPFWDSGWSSTRPLTSSVHPTWYAVMDCDHQLGMVHGLVPSWWHRQQKFRRAVPSTVCRGPGVGRRSQ